MGEYIDKSALVAEIKKHRAIWDGMDGDYCKGQRLAYSDVISIINTLEIKAVDLENELNDFIEEQKAWVKDDRVVEYDNGDSFNHIYDLESIAKHFFELGLQVNNPITAADRGMAEEIIINLKRLKKDYRIDLTKEMEWLRNKVKK